MNRTGKLMAACAAMTLSVAILQAPPTPAQENSMTVSQESRSKVLDVLDVLSAAVLSDDRSAADGTLAETFQGVGHVGNIVGKEKYLDIHFSPERDFTTFKGSDQAVLKAGNGYVVVGKFSVVNAKSDDGERVYSMTATVAPDDAGELKIVTWQETFITDETF